MAGTLDAMIGSIAPNAVRDSKKRVHVNQESQDLQTLNESEEIHRQAKKNIERKKTLSRDPYSTFVQELDGRRPTSLPLEEYLRAAYEYDRAYPQSTDHYEFHSPMFQFARLAKGHPDFAEHDAIDALETVEFHMSCWNDDDARRNVWEQYFEDEGTVEDLRTDFMNSWESIRFLPGCSPLVNALRKGDVDPLSPPAERGEGYRRFVSLAGWLQAVNPEAAIMLPVKSLAELLSVAPHTISVYRKWAVKDELLRELKAAIRPTSGAGRATEFRFAIEKYPQLSRRTS